MNTKQKTPLVLRAGSASYQNNVQVPEPQAQAWTQLLQPRTQHKIEPCDSQNIADCIPTSSKYLDEYSRDIFNTHA